MSVVVIIPTYNERESLEQLVVGIFSQPIKDLRVLIVDDNSPDGTGLIADSLAKKFPLSVIHRKSKEGLGTAYIEAFVKILSGKRQVQPDFIFAMDGDFSHDPNDLPRFLNSIQQSDIVLGSRYVRGGYIENWNILRRMISRFGNIYARILLRLPYKDLTGGYKLYRRKVLEKLDVKTLSSIGYNFQIETTYRAHKAGLKIREIPIVFSERKQGKSKFNFLILWESFWKILRVRFRG